MQWSNFCLSYSDTHVRMLEDCIQETILEQNKLAAGSDRSVSDDVKEIVIKWVVYKWLALDVGDNSLILESDIKMHITSYKTG